MISALVTIRGDLLIMETFNEHHHWLVLESNFDSRELGWSDAFLMDQILKELEACIIGLYLPKKWNFFLRE